LVSFLIPPIRHLNITKYKNTVKKRGQEFPVCERLFWLDKVRAVVSKRGVDDGNQKGGGSLQPAQENQYDYNRKKWIVKGKYKIY